MYSPKALEQDGAHDAFAAFDPLLGAGLDLEAEEALLYRRKRARSPSPDPVDQDPFGLVTFLSRKCSRLELHVQIPMDYESDPSDKRAKFGDSEESAAETEEASDDYGSDFDSPDVSPVPTDDESGSESDGDDVMLDFIEYDSDWEKVEEEAERYVRAQTPTVI